MSDPTPQCQFARGGVSSPVFIKHLLCAKYRVLNKIVKRDNVCALMTFTAGEEDG